MHYVDLLRPRLFSIRRVEEFDLTRLNAELRANVAEIKIDRTIKALNLVLDEERHLDVAVLKELVHLLTNDCVVIGIETGTHLIESLFCGDDMLLGFCASDQLLHRFQMLVSNEHKLFWLDG